MSANVLRFSVIEGGRDARKPRGARRPPMDVELAAAVKALALLYRKRPTAFRILAATFNSLLKEGR